MRQEGAPPLNAPRIRNVNLSPDRFMIRAPSAADPREIGMRCSRLPRGSAARPPS